MVAESSVPEERYNCHPPVPYSSDVAPIKNVPTPSLSPGKKVTVVGCGQVGLAVAYSIVNQQLCSSLALVDINAKKLEGEAKDLRQGCAFYSRIHIESGSEYDVSAKSDLVIVTAGVAQKPGQSRLALMGVNVKIMKAIIPQVLKYSPNASICIASNPCDVMTAVAAKIAGPEVPPGRIFGSGTSLDSSRLRTYIGNALGINPNSIHASMIGEHGDSSVAAFSTARIGSVPLLKPGEEPSKVLKDIEKKVIESAGEVIKLKGYTNWAIGLIGAHIAKIVLDNQHSVIPVSTCVRGYLGIKTDTYLSVPCVLGAAGVTSVFDLPLSDTETKQFLDSAKKVNEVQSDIWDTV